MKFNVSILEEDIIDELLLMPRTQLMDFIKSLDQQLEDYNFTWEMKHYFIEAEKEFEDLEDEE
jgi:uridine kinase